MGAASIWGGALSGEQIIPGVIFPVDRLKEGLDQLADRNLRLQAAEQ